MLLSFVYSRLANAYGSCPKVMETEISSWKQAHLALGSLQKIPSDLQSYDIREKKARKDFVSSHHGEIVFFD